MSEERAHCRKIVDEIDQNYDGYNLSREEFIELLMNERAVARAEVELKYRDLQDVARRAEQCLDASAASQEERDVKAALQRALREDSKC